MRFLLIILLTLSLPTRAHSANCTQPDRPVGQLVYNADWGVFQGCTPAGWVRFNQPTTTPPPACPDIGDLCPDGTVYAGLHPVTNEKLYLPPTDQEKPGSPGIYTMNWKNAAGTNDINPDSNDDGRANHANRSGQIADFEAFNACESLNFGGHNDWYLPARNELNLLYTNKNTLQAKGHITGFQSAVYRSSTENNANYAWIKNFTDGYQTSTTKMVSSRVRCIRR